MCVRERERECMCVCEREREREREWCVCVFVVCVCGGGGSIHACISSYLYVNLCMYTCDILYRSVTHTRTMYSSSEGNHLYQELTELVSLVLSV